MVGKAVRPDPTGSKNGTKSNYRTIAVQMSSMGTFSRGRKVPAKPSSEGHKQRELDVDGLARGRDGSSNLAPRGFEFHARHSA